MCSELALTDTHWALRGDDVLLPVRLTPKSSRDAIEGIEHLSDGRRVLKARVRAVPEGGKANEALIKLIAKALSVPASAVKLEAGAASRIKTLRVTGDPAGLAAGLRRLCCGG